jgi:hypothetical protein
LEQLKGLLKHAYEERSVLIQEITRAESEDGVKVHRYQSWERGFLLKRLFKKCFAERKDVSETAKAKTSRAA